MFFVVPRANDLCFLGIIRSLQEKSKIVSLSYSWKGAKFLSDYSNSLINIYKTPNPAKEPYKFIRKLVEIGKFLKSINNQKSFYIPSSDTNMMVAVDNWNKLSNNIKVKSIFLGLFVFIFLPLILVQLELSLLMFL